MTGVALCVHATALLTRLRAVMLAGTDASAGMVEKERELAEREASSRPQFGEQAHAPIEVRRKAPKAHVFGCWLQSAYAAHAAAYPDQQARRVKRTPPPATSRV